VSIENLNFFKKNSNSGGRVRTKTRGKLNLKRLITIPEIPTRAGKAGTDFGRLVLVPTFDVQTIELSMPPACTTAA